MPVHNAQKYLKVALDCVLAQTFGDFELICINDGSTDDSVLILDKYAQKDSRIRVINLKNQGVSATRNLGMELARGEYIYFVDADDIIETNLLKKCIEKMNESNYDIVIFDSDFVPSWFTVDKMDTLSHYVRRNDSFLVLGACWNKLFRRSFLINNKLRFLETINKHEDLFFCTMCFYHKPTYCVIKDFLYHYRRGVSTSLTNLTSLELASYAKVVLKEVISTPEFANVDFEMKVVLCETMFGIVLYNWKKVPGRKKRQDILDYFQEFMFYVEARVDKKVLVSSNNYVDLKQIVQFSEEAGKERPAVNKYVEPLLDWEKDLSSECRAPKSVLIIEPDIMSHLEGVTELAEYFLERGNYVDLMISPHQFTKKKFARFTDKDIKIWAMGDEFVKKVMRSEKIKDYKAVIFTSLTDRFMGKSIFDMFNVSKALREKLYVVENKYSDDYVNQVDLNHRIIIDKNRPFTSKSWEVLDEVFDRKFKLFDEDTKKVQAKKYWRVAEKGLDIGFNVFD